MNNADVYIEKSKAPQLPPPRARIGRRSPSQDEILAGGEKQPPVISPLDPKKSDPMAPIDSVLFIPVAVRTRVSVMLPQASLSFQWVAGPYAVAIPCVEVHTAVGRASV